MSGEKKFVFVPPPDVTLDRAKRYASALSAAAAANQRIQELEGQLTTSEFLRDQIELELASVKWESDFGRVFTQVDDEPDHDFIVDLRTGEVWARDDAADDRHERWRKQDGRGSDGYICGWPIEDAGPFMAVTEDWSLAQIVKQLDQRAAEDKQLHRFLQDLDGYKDPDGDSRWVKPDLARAVVRVVEALKKKAIEEGLVRSRHQTEAADAAVEVAELKLKAAKGYGPVLDGIVSAMPAKGSFQDRTVHSMVREAELAIIQDCDVPVEGDPTYLPASLMTAAAILVATLDRLVDEQTKRAAAVFEGDVVENDLPF